MESWLSGDLALRTAIEKSGLLLVSVEKLDRASYEKIGTEPKEETDVTFV